MGLGHPPPRLCVLPGSGLWPPGRTCPRVAGVGPVPKTPHLTPCHLSAPFSQLFFYRGATRPWAGEVWGPRGEAGGGVGDAGGTVPFHPAGSIPLGSALSPSPPQSSAGQTPQPGAQHGVQRLLQPHHQDQLQVGATGGVPGGGTTLGHPFVRPIPMGLSRGFPPPPPPDTPQHLRGPGVVAGGRRGDPLQPGLRAERAGGGGPRPRALLRGSFPRQRHRLPALPQGPSEAHGDGGPLPDAGQ